MQRLLQTTFAATAAALGLYAVGARAEVTDTRMLEESLAVPASEPLTVIVKNVIGSIRVTGHDLDRVEMRATETVRGDLRADIDRARMEVELRTEQEPGRIAFRVRHSGDDADRGHYGQGWEGYTVEYDIELRVPRTAMLDLATVNDGDITTEGVSGNFTIRNVNGAVQLGGGGSGSVTTVNGKIAAAFASAPTGPTSFKTVNGDVDVTLPNTLAADLNFKTMNGDVFTDFEVEQLAQTPVKQRERGLFVMRTNRDSAFRVGAGGDPLSFHTLNGNIYVRKATR
jgi:Putative adhesin